jgi:hypothetical protein
MADNISLIENNELEDKIQIIMRQTDYSKEKAKEHLLAFNGDHLEVIRSFLGVSKKKSEPIKSVNQEIYRQIRHRLDGSMRDYNERKERDETKL